MFRILAVVVLGGVTLAGIASASPKVAPPPPPAKRKNALVTYQPLQLQIFAKAVMADKRGDLDEAEREYDSVVRIAPVANAYWNLADVARRRERLQDAVKHLEKYLELAETDADKKAAETLIAELKATPYVLSVSGEEPGGTIFIDGVKFAAPAPVMIHLDPGQHMIDWIGHEGYEHTSYNARPMQDDIARMGDGSSRDRDKTEKGGNVILSVSSEFPVSNAWEYNGATFKLNARFTLPPGHYETPIYDPNRACSNLVFDVPRDGAVFVYIKAERPQRSSCYPITVTSTKVKP